MSRLICSIHEFRSSGSWRSCADIRIYGYICNESILWKIQMYALRFRKALQNTLILRWNTVLLIGWNICGNIWSEVVYLDMGTEGYIWEKLQHDHINVDEIEADFINWWLFLKSICRKRGNFMNAIQLSCKSKYYGKSRNLNLNLDVKEVNSLALSVQTAPVNHHDTYTARPDAPHPVRQDFWWDNPEAQSQNSFIYRLPAFEAVFYRGMKVKDLLQNYLLIFITKTVLWREILCRRLQLDVNPGRSMNYLSIEKVAIVSALNISQSFWS